MKTRNRIIAAAVLLCLILAFTPVVSQAADMLYFIAVNDEILRLSADTMPLRSGNDYFIPVSAFEKAGVYSVGSDVNEVMTLYRFKGVIEYVTFNTTPGNTSTVAQGESTLYWPAARRIGRRFYVPLRQVCSFFDLTYEVNVVSKDIFPDEDVTLVRIISEAKINIATLAGLYRKELKADYNDYYAPVTSPSPSPGSPGQPGEPGLPQPPPTVEPPPTYGDVTVHLSFCDIAAGGVDSILGTLSSQAAPGYDSCFFVSADDILNNPALIRRIAGSGHIIGIRLVEDTYEEYIRTSALLFEAAKVRTVLVSSGSEVWQATPEVAAAGLVLWDSRALVSCAGENPLEIIDGAIPKESGARRNLMLDCSEITAAALPVVITYLQVNEYTIERITETVKPTEPEVPKDAGAVAPDGTGAG